jgi:hypothetical protein
MEFLLQGMPNMLHNKSRKSKGEKRVLIKDLSNIYMQEVLQTKPPQMNADGHESEIRVHRRSSVAYSA